MSTKPILELCRDIEFELVRLARRLGAPSLNVEGFKNLFNTLVAKIVDSSGRIDPAKLSALSPTEQADVGEALLALSKEIEDAMVDGPDDERHLMHKSFTSTRSIILLLALASIFTILNLVAIYYAWPPATAGYSIDDLRNQSTNVSQPNPATPGEKKADGSAGLVPNASAQGTQIQTTQSAADQTSTQAPVHIEPETALLYPGQSKKFTVVGTAKLTEWVDPPAGAISATGLYIAPMRIADSQTIRIEAKVDGVTTPLRSAILLNPPPGPKEENVLLMIMLMGFLGGLIHLVSSVCVFVGNRQFMRSWTPYYLLMPLEGSALAVACYLLLRVGVLSPGANANGATSSLNLIGLYGFAILTGIFSKQALQMLGDVFNTIFKKVQAKDAPKDQKPETTK